MRIVHSFVFAAALLLAALSPRSAAAEGDAAKDKETARALAERGFELFEQGEAEKAIVSFRMAERRIHSPVHQLFIARAEVKLGRFVDALSIYEEVVRETVPPGSPKPFLTRRTTRVTRLSRCGPGRRRYKSISSASPRRPRRSRWTASL